MAAGAGMGEAMTAGIALLGRVSGVMVLSSWGIWGCSTAVAIVSVVGGAVLRLYFILLFC